MNSWAQMIWAVLESVMWGTMQCRSWTFPQGSSVVNPSHLSALKDGLYLCVSAEAGLQEVGEFRVPERDVEGITLQSAEHLKESKPRPLTFDLNQSLSV